MFAVRRAEWPAYAALAAILAAGLTVRLHNIGHGLPFVYHPDEALHFTSRAVWMLESGGLDPVYLANPSAFTYLVYGLLRLTGGGGAMLGDAGDLVAQLARDPAPAYLDARRLATALCMLAVLAVFLVARRLWGPAEGVAAAGVLSFAFLPVAYSRYALTDAGVLLPVAVAVYAAVRAGEDGRARYFVLGGAAMGLAIGFKYTAGLVGVPLLAAGLLRARREPRAAAYVAVSGLAAAGTFFLTTPHFFLDLPAAVDQLAKQNAVASEPKVGQGEVEPVSFYLGTLTWGFGWGAALAAAAGLAYELRRDPRRALLLALFPLAFFLYLSTAGRFFARWLMPIYPVLALLAGVALAAAARHVARRSAVRAAVLALLLAAVLAQPIAADVRTVRMLGREDTRTLARDHLLRTLPPGARVVVEPAVPADYLRGRLVRGFRPPPPGAIDGGSAQRFILTLEPRSIDRYRRAGYCTVVTLDTITERARRDGIRPALAYYARLERESDLVFEATPFRPGARRPPFSIDKSTHLYFDAAYARPGPVVRIHRLRRCGQRAGGPPTRAPVPASLRRAG